MSKKDVFEEYLDQVAESNRVTTVQKDNEREVQEILNLRYDNSDLLERLIKVLVAKGVVSLKDFKRVLGE